MNEFPVGKFIQSDDPKELCSFFAGNRYLCGFVQTQTPTNHCMAVPGISGEHFVLMGCARENPRFMNARWDFLKSTAADMLLVFAK